MRGSSSARCRSRASITSTDCRPAIAIEQKNLGHTPRSTVGTVTEVYDYLRILLARLGTPYCPQCDMPVGTQTTDEIMAKVMQAPEGTRLYLLAPVEVSRRAGLRIAVERHQGQRIPAACASMARRTAWNSPPSIDRRRKHRVEVVVDRVVVKPAARGRIAEAVESGVALGKGVLHVVREQPDVPESQWETVRHSQHLACDRCGRSFEQLTPHNFSFNSPLGWCPACEGLGTQTGANPAALLQDAKLTLREGAVALWPNVQHQVSQWMLQALSAGTGLPIDVPFDQLNGAAPPDHHARVRRAVVRRVPRRPAHGGPLFRFQFKGLYPALEEAARLSPVAACAAGTPDRPSRVLGVRRQPLARRCGGRAVPGPDDRRTVSAADGAVAAGSHALETVGARPQDRRRVAAGNQEPHAVPQRRGVALPDAGAGPPRSPTEKLSAFGWPAS